MAGTGRLPSITEPDDFAALSYAHAHAAELPLLSESVRDALVTAGWIASDGMLNDAGIAEAAKWAQVREQTKSGYRFDGPLRPIHHQPDAWQL